jgi:hypothetical protein
MFSQWVYGHPRKRSLQLLSRGVSPTCSRGRRGRDRMITSETILEYFTLSFYIALPFYIQFLTPTAFWFLVLFI